jgi:hypothetical protein
MSSIKSTVSIANPAKEFKKFKVNVGVQVEVTRAVDYDDLVDLVKYDLPPNGFAEKLMCEVINQIREQL